VCIIEAKALVTPTMRTRRRMPCDNPVWTATVVPTLMVGLDTGGNGPDTEIDRGSCGAIDLEPSPVLERLGQMAGVQRSHFGARGAVSNTQLILPGPIEDVK
jgi:hypothetical protein